MVFMKKIFSHVFLPMKILCHVVISMVTKIRLGTKSGIYDYMIRNGQ